MFLRDKTKKVIPCVDLIQTYLADSDKDPLKWILGSRWKNENIYLPSIIWEACFY